MGWRRWRVGGGLAELVRSKAAVADVWMARRGESGGGRDVEEVSSGEDDRRLSASAYSTSQHLTPYGSMSRTLLSPIVASLRPLARPILQPSPSTSRTLFGLPSFPFAPPTAHPGRGVLTKRGSTSIYSESEVMPYVPSHGQNTNLDLTSWGRS